MSRSDAEFLRRIRRAFRAEAAEHLQAVAQGLLAMERSAPNLDPALVEAVFRHTHSLKGAARAAGFVEVEAVCQALESVFALCKRRRLALAAEHYDRLHRSFDLVGVLVAAEADLPPDAEARVRLAVDALSVLERQSNEGASDTDASTQPPTQAHAMPADIELPVLAALGDHTRVATPALDRLLYAVEDMLACRQRGKEAASRLREIGGQFDAWDKQWSGVQAALRSLRREADVPGASGSLQGAVRFLDFTYGHMRALEQRINGAGERAARDAEALGRQVDDLLAQSKALLLLPFSSLADVMPRAMRDLARSQGKDVELQIEGGGVRIDKRLLDQLKDPVLHLLRNAVDHGVETPAQRRAAGKSATARITLTARVASGGKIEIVMEDDGRGIDAEAVRNAALRRGVIGQVAAAGLDDAASIDLVFHSDVSTSPMPTEISGRGLGLAIVRETIAKLGGHASVVNRAEGAGAGTRFLLVLPQTFGAFRGLFVRVDEQSFVLPTLHVRGVARIARSEIRTIRNRETVPWGGGLVAVVPLAELLELRADRHAERAQPWSIVVFLEAGSEVLGVTVDEVLDEDDVLVKSLARPLVRVRNVAGATIDASGCILPVLNTGDLVKTARRPRSPGRRAGAATPGQRPGDVRILLAEDSITSRLLLKGILESAGYQVRTAVDGIDAFTLLRNEGFDVLVSDIEMPRLNGFDLTARVRSDPVLAALPVVLVTALSKREERERGIDVGANAYITKGGFDQRTLLDAVRQLVRTKERA